MYYKPNKNVNIIIGQRYSYLIDIMCVHQNVICLMTERSIGSIPGELVGFGGLCQLFTWKIITPNTPTGGKNMWFSEVTFKYKRHLLLAHYGQSISIRDHLLNQILIEST